MTSEPTAKRCLLCDAMVPPNAVKCTACGKGRFETVKRHAEDRPRPAAAAPLPRAGTPPAAGPAPHSASPTAPARAPAAPRGTWLSRLLSRLTGR